MRFIYIHTRNDGRMAINPDAISTIRDHLGTIYIYVSGDKAIETKFTNIQSAVDYIQRAQSISSTQGV